MSGVTLTIPQLRTSSARTPGQASVVLSKAPTLLPPEGFGFVDEGLCRCVKPLLRCHFPFLRSLCGQGSKETDRSVYVSSVVNVSDASLTPDVLALFADLGVNIHDSPYENGQEVVVANESDEGLSGGAGTGAGTGRDSHSNSYSSSSTSTRNLHIRRGATVSSLEEWVKQTIELILSLCTTSTVLIIGSEEAYLDCLLVACLRKLQSWSLVAIISELRIAIGPHKKLQDLEQFIELFNPNIINFTCRPPDFIATHQHLIVEEEKLIERIQSRGYLDVDAMQRTSSRGGGANIADKEKAKEKEKEKDKEKEIDDLGDEEEHLSEEELQQKQHEIDSILFSLFFPASPFRTLSPGISYDASVSLINDDDDVD